MNEDAEVPGPPHRDTTVIGAEVGPRHPTEGGLVEDPPPQYSALVEFRFAGEPSEALMRQIEDILDDVLPRLTAPDMFSDDFADPFDVTCDANIRWVRPIYMERP